MYVEHLYTKELARRELRKPPRERYAIYQRDLHRIADDVLSEETLFEGDQYSYTDLGDAVLGDAERDGVLKEVDLAVYAYWTPEFDPDYSAFGPYFMERYGIAGQSFDVCDNGSLASITALDLVSRYIAGDGSIRRVLLLGMEQTTVPRNLEQGVPIPSRSAAMATILTPESPAARLRVIGCGHIPEAEVAGGIDALDLAGRLFRQAGIGPHETTLLTQRCGSFHKHLRYQLDTTGKDSPFPIRFLDPAPSALGGLRALALALDETRAPGRFTLLVDHDLESLRLAWAVVERRA